MYYMNINNKSENNNNKGDNMRKKRTIRNIKNEKGLSMIETIGFMASVTAALMASIGIVVFSFFK